MTLNTISLKSWRNFSQKEFSFHPEINVISGENGIGKTNLLEAVFYLSCCRGLPGAKESDLINFEDSQSEIKAEFQSGSREQNISVLLKRNTRRSLWLNHAPISSPRLIMGVLPAVFFRPEDLLLLRGGASVRREYMDLALCQMRPLYVEKRAVWRCVTPTRTNREKMHQSRHHWPVQLAALVHQGST